MLTYVFRAYFADGTTYTQTPDDQATLADRGSCYSDVVWLQEHGAKLDAFALIINPGIDAALPEPLAAVHLTDGHFELDGYDFYAGVDGLDIHGVDRRLIYFRQDVPNAAMTRYVIGWQATIAGRNVQHMIALDG